jgi:hypothetical protein
MDTTSYNLSEHSAYESKLVHALNNISVSEVLTIETLRKLRDSAEKIRLPKIFLAGKERYIVEVKTAPDGLTPVPKSMVRSIKRDYLKNIGVPWWKRIFVSSKGLTLYSLDDMIVAEA